jgi:hypothetical protein
MTRTERALRTSHLVEVACALKQELRLDVDGMRALRLPVDLLDYFPDWQRGSTRGFRPRRLGVTLLPDAASRPLRGLRLQVSPSAGGIPIVITLLGELGRRLDADVRLYVLVDPDVDLALLRRTVRAAFGKARVQFVAAEFSTVFARDNALAARDGAGQPVLVVPRKVRGVKESDADALDRRVVHRALGVRVVASRFDWQGGNLLYDGITFAIGADTIVENAARLGLTRDEVITGLSTEFATEITILGDVQAGRIAEQRHRMLDSGQASYHLDLDVAVLGRVHPQRAPVALVADASSGLKLIGPAIRHGQVPRPPYLSVAQSRVHMLNEYGAAAREREPRLRVYRDTLTARGYRVVAVPELRTRHFVEGVSGVQDFVYCNVLPGLNRHRPSVHYLPTGVAALDLAARRAYESAGVRPVRITRTPYLAAAMIERAAGLRCFCGSMP